MMEEYKFSYQHKALRTVDRQVAPHILKMLEAQAARAMAQKLIADRLFGITFDGATITFTCAVLRPSSRVDDDRALPEHERPVGTVTIEMPPRT